MEQTTAQVHRAGLCPKCFTLNAFSHSVTDIGDDPNLKMKRLRFREGE